MPPIVILDSNALYGPKPFTNLDIVLLLALSEAEHLRLVVPEVVLHELSRQWDDRVRSNIGKAQTAVDKLNDALHEVDAPPIAFSPPEVGRSTFYDHAVKLLQEKRVEISALPAVTLAEVMERDLDTRKPFNREGKGFRDALIWESVREVCAARGGSELKTLFVTANVKDFCNPKGDRLHEDLAAELPEGYQLETLQDLKALIAHEDVSPLVETLRIEKSFTPKLLSKLVDEAVSDLFGRSVDDVLGVYIGDGMTEVPIHVGIMEAVFEDISPDDSTITSSVYRVGDEFSISVTVEVDCAFEGFVDHHAILYDDDSVFLYARDWNDHVAQVGVRHQFRLLFSSTFTEETRDQVELSLDTAEEL